jgi:enoyl-CoA hydratase/carnithine racemase
LVVLTQFYALALSSYLLPRLVGYSLASQLLLSGKTLSASHPLLSSLYYSILPSREDVLPAALAFATEIAKNTSAPAIAMTKMLMWRGSGMGSPEEQHILESRTIRTLGQSRDGAEGVKSFMEKRKPEFKGTLGEDLPDWVPWVCT